MVTIKEMELRITAAKRAFNDAFWREVFEVRKIPAQAADPVGKNLPSRSI